MRPIANHTTNVLEDEPEVAAASAEEKEENVRLDETIISESPVDHQEPESVE